MSVLGLEIFNKNISWVANVQRSTTLTKNSLNTIPANIQPVSIVSFDHVNMLVVAFRAKP